MTMRKTLSVLFAAILAIALCILAVTALSGEKSGSNLHMTSKKEVLAEKSSAKVESTESPSANVASAEDSFEEAAPSESTAAATAQEAEGTQALNTVTTRVTLNGAPIEGVLVTLYFYDTSDGSADYVAEACSDATGCVTIPDIPDAGSYRFEVFGTDHYVYHFSEIFALPGAIPIIELDAGQTATTTVTLNGVPQEGVLVYACDANDICVTKTTDKNGIVTFPRLPTGTEIFFLVWGTNEFVEYQGGYLQNIFTLPGNVPTIELDAGASATTTVTLGGIPQAGVEVHAAVNAEESLVYTAITDASGKAVFPRLPTGEEFYFFLDETDAYFMYNGRHINKTFTLPGAAPAIKLIDKAIEVVDNPK